MKATPISPAQRLLQVTFLIALYGLILPCHQQGGGQLRPEWPGWNSRLRPLSASLRPAFFGSLSERPGNSARTDISVQGPGWIQKAQSESKLSAQRPAAQLVLVERLVPVPGQGQRLAYSAGVHPPATVRGGARAGGPRRSSLVVAVRPDCRVLLRQGFRIASR